MFALGFLMDSHHLRRLSRVQRFDLAGGADALAADHQVVLAPQLRPHFLDGVAHGADVVVVAEIGQRLVAERALGRLDLRRRGGQNLGSSHGEVLEDWMNRLF